MSYNNGPILAIPLWLLVVVILILAPSDRESEERALGRMVLAQRLDHLAWTTWQTRTQVENAPR